MYKLLATNDAAVQVLVFGAVLDVRLTSYRGIDMVLFSLTVLLIMGMDMVIDFESKSAISTEEILSISNVVVECSSKTCVPIFLHIIYFFPPDPCP
jgi:cell shape-determining protein MreD